MKPRFARSLALIAPLAFLLATRADAQTYNLNFSGLGPNDAAIPGSYGDVAGIVNVSMGHRSGWGNSTLTDASGYAWRFNYTELIDVGYPASGTGVGEISFANLLAGTLLTFNSANVGAYFDRSIPVELRVYNSAWTLLFASSGNTASLASVLFSAGVSDVSGLYVQWSGIDSGGNPNDAYNVGIDNVNFTSAPTVSAVPEPATLSLFTTGLIGLGFAARRRSRR